MKKTKLLKNPEQKTETFNVPENQCQLIKLFPVKKKSKDTEVNYDTV